MSAFERCVIQFGLDKTTLQKVANEAELPRSLVRYFVGNREDMITLLLTRMSERAEQSIAEQFPNDPTLAELLDFVFDGAFSNTTSNEIVDQLWQLSHRDPIIKEQLKSLYSQLRQKLVASMRAEGLPNTTQHYDLAQSMIALAYGEACFEDIGLKTKKRSASRAIADALIGQLKVGDKN